MTIAFVFIALLSLTIAAVAVWQLQKMFVLTTQLQRNHSNALQPTMELFRQMQEIRQVVAGMITSMRAMGNQVHSLHAMANQMSQPDMSQPQQIMLELQRQLPALEDIPPEVQAEIQRRLKVFQQLNHAITEENTQFPSRNHPEQN